MEDLLLVTGILKMFCTEHRLFPTHLKPQLLFLMNQETNQIVLCGSISGFTICDSHWYDYPRVEFDQCCKQYENLARIGNVSFVKKDGHIFIAEVRTISAPEKNYDGKWCRGLDHITGVIDLGVPK